MNNPLSGRFRIDSLVRAVIIVVGAFIVLLPIFWMVTTSLKTPGDMYRYPPQFIPRAVTFANYAEAFTSLPFAKFILNTIYVSSFIVVGQVFICALAAYAFAKLRFPGSNVLFVLYLGTLMVPEIVLIIPNFIVMKSFGWIDSFKALIVPGIFINTAFGTFLLRQFFSTIPASLTEAAKIDGASIIQTLFRIVFPNSKPALTSLGIYILARCWNDFMWPLTIINSIDKKTLSIGLTSFQGLVVKNWGVIMAGATITAIPMLVAFLFAQKYFIEGVTLTGMK